MKRQISSKILAVLLVGILTTMAAAQPPDGPPPDAPRWGKERIETVIIGKFSTELNLTPEQAEKFFPRFRQLQNSAEDMQRNQRQRRQELDQLSQDPKADKSQVNNLVEQNSKDQESMLRLKQDFLKDVSGFLTPQQVSRCSILLDELPQRVRQMIEERRGQGMGPGGQGQGQGRGHGRRGY